MFNDTQDRLRILIIDDNTAIHQDFNKILNCSSDHDLEQLEEDLFGTRRAHRQAMFELEFASQGEEGFAKVQAAVAEGRPFAVAFVDVRMPPGWDGVETIKHLWQVQPDLQVVICTAYSDYSWSELVAELGESDHLLILRKPFDSAEVCQLAAALTQKYMVERDNKRYRAQLEQQLESQCVSLDRTRMDLASAHALFQSTLDALSSELAVLDDHGTILHVNQAWQEDNGGSPMVGAACQVGTNYVEFLRSLGEEDTPAASKLIDGLEQVLEGRESIVMEYECSCGETGTRYYTVRINRFTETSGGTIVLTHDDVTEFKTMEKQLNQAQKLEALGQLAAGVAHEINTPMQYLGDNISLMRNCLRQVFEALDELDRLATDQAGPQRQDLQQWRQRFGLSQVQSDLEAALDDCQEGYERVTSITRAMKQFSHPGKAAMESVNLNELVVAACTVTRNRWKYVAELKTDLDAELGLCQCNVGEVNQVLLNLIVNACDAMAEKHENDDQQLGQLILRTRDEGAYVRLEVADTGTGIPAQIRERIFDPFFTTKDVGKGTGQGLSICYNVVVNSHNGSISVDSAEGHGTTFVVRLPKHHSEDAAERQDLHQHQPGGERHAEPGDMEQHDLIG
ncbi:MAG: hybrid sensor histidine kinase/response regulator [Planctomycetota bacterium]|nr:MAG: hybrid sensor histidine kinase/response regulator [Planctomycetota bacterium]